MKVFISWSGEPTKKVASAMQAFLRKILQHVKPFVSDTEIRAGERWSNEIGQELASSAFGICILSPKNIHSPWVNFEAGAIAQQLDKRVAPYLVGFPELNVPASSPLRQFQAVKATKDDTRKLVMSIHDVDPGPVTREEVSELFETFWPQFEDRLTTLPDEEVVSPQADVPQQIGEILQTVRELSGSVVDLSSKVLQQRNGWVTPRAGQQEPVNTDRISGYMNARARAILRDTAIDVLAKCGHAIDAAATYFQGEAPVVDPELPLPATQTRIQSLAGTVLLLEFSEVLNEVQRTKISNLFGGTVLWLRRLDPVVKDTKV